MTFLQENMNEKSLLLRRLFPRDKRKAVRLTNSVLERLSSLEGWDLHRRDGDLLRWVAWVDTRASLTLGNAERAEARYRNIVTLLELFGDSTNESLESV